MTTPLSSPSRNSFWKRRCHFPSRTTRVWPQAGHWYGFADARECPMTALRCLPAGGDFGLDMNLFLKEFRCRTVVCPLAQSIEVLLHLRTSGPLDADALLLLRRHVLRWNLGLHRHAGRRLRPLKLGVARCLPDLHLLGFDEPLPDLAQPLVVAAAALRSGE